MVTLKVNRGVPCNSCICIPLYFKAKETWRELGGTGRLIRTQLNKVLNNTSISFKQPERERKDEEDQELPGLTWMFLRSEPCIISNSEQATSHWLDLFCLFVCLFYQRVWESILSTHLYHSPTPSHTLLCLTLCLSLGSHHPRGEQETTGRSAGDFPEGTAS